MTGGGGGDRRAGGTGGPALAIRTTWTPPGKEPPYLDEEGPDGLIRYAYCGDDPDCGVTNLPAQPGTPALLATLVRQHWAIEAAG